MGPAEDREQLDGCRQLVLDHMRRPTLRIGGVGIDPGAHHELTLVGLADIDVNRVRHDDAVQHRLE